jgi:protoporphyrinogen oxidase
MKVAILGGGFAGLSAAYYLRKKGHSVALFEREKVLGGLAIGFKAEGWSWPLEKAYHHLFTTDKAMLDLAKDTQFQGIFFQTPQTASLYKIDNNYRIIPVDSPRDFISFPLLSWLDKARGAVVYALLKLGPALPLYNVISGEKLFSAIMGKKAWETIFGGLMRNKFGKYAGNIVAMFIWARVKVRNSSLGYIKGGFQTWVEFLEKKVKKNGVVIRKSHEVLGIEKRDEQYYIRFRDEKGEESGEEYDAVISTLPSPILSRIAGNLFPTDYFDRFKKLKYLNAVVMIIQSQTPILKKTYWLSICTPDIPTMLVAQHTNFIDKKNYGGNELAYVAWYVDPKDAVWNMSQEEIVDMMTPELKKINPGFDLKKAKTYLFKAPFAQPVFDKDFVANKPTFVTPLKKFYIANLDMTYPNDRGTNYAVALGKKVSELLESQK